VHPRPRLPRLPRSGRQRRRHRRHPDDAQRELNQREAQIRPACEHILRRLPASVQDDGGGGKDLKADLGF